MAKFVAVAKSHDLPPGRALSVELGRRTVALFNVDGRLYALDDTCTHSGGPLSEGEVRDGNVVCPWHGAEFALADGKCTSEFARQTRVYAVRERDGLLELEDPDG